MVLGIALCCIAALLPSLLLYFPNMDDIPLVNMLPYFGIMLGIGILAWAGMYLITRRKGLAAVAAALWLLVLLNVGRIVPALQDVVPWLGFKIIVPVVLVVLAAVTFGLSRLKEEFLNDAVKVLCLALAAFILTSAVPRFFRSEKPAEEAETTALKYDLAPAEGTDRPNIYWIISDEYAGLDQLRKYYNYDNSEFYDSLRALGFTVSDDSYNWYPDTYTVLRDIMSLRYTAGPRTMSGKKEILSETNLPMWNLMRGLGYELYEAESTNKFHLSNRLKKEIGDDTPQTADGSTVANLLLQYSILYRYEEQILQFVAPSLADTATRGAVLDVLEWAENPENMKDPGPNFTVIYLKSPHGPFVFDRNGDKVPYDKQAEVKEKKYYLDQLVYISGRLLKVCENITQTDPDAIVVLQSDHGHRNVDNVTWLDMTNVLNAVYFRGEPLDGVEGRNALNTWIAVLRKQFNLDLPEVEEKRQKLEYRENYRDSNAEDPNEEILKNFQ